MRAVLVLPEMPEGCVNCALCRMENRKGYNDYICVPKNQLAPMAMGTDKPDWCPLREMPPRTDVYPEEDGVEWAKGYVTGYNACLRDAEGSEEDETIDGEK